ncbi:unnamed protein product, partial [Mycena citricolor]
MSDSELNNCSGIRLAIPLKTGRSNAASRCVLERLVMRKQSGSRWTASSSAMSISTCSWASSRSHASKASMTT